MGQGKIVCIGQNYRAHAKEMHSQPPKEPIIFLKPTSALLGDGETIEAGDVGRVDHEVELALIIGRKAKNVPADQALKYVSEIAVFNDITARDMQATARKAGNPWSLAKGMDTFAPMSTPVPLASVRDVHDLEIELRVNGQVRQRGNTSDMIFSPEQLIAYISRFMTLEPGDIIATGTPEGVSPLNDGDNVEAEIKGVGRISNVFRRI
jgi:acylpyruvate hydrolase